jgi:hypothetical protein
LLKRPDNDEAQRPIFTEVGSPFALPSRYH